MALTKQEISKRYYEAHKEDCLRRSREWKQRTKAYTSEQTKGTKRAWYQANAERIRRDRKLDSRSKLSARRYRDNNLEATRESSRSYMQSVDKDRRRAWGATYRERNRSRLQQKARDSYRDDPARRDACKKNAAVRKLRVRGASSIDRSLNRLQIFERDGGICHICRLPVELADFHLDHIIPLIRGGSHTAENVAVSHSRCNRRKGAR